MVVAMVSVGGLFRIADFLDIYQEMTVCALVFKPRGTQTHPQGASAAFAGAKKNSKKKTSASVWTSCIVPLTDQSTFEYHWVLLYTRCSKIINYEDEITKVITYLIMFMFPGQVLPHLRGTSPSTPVASKIKLKMDRRTKRTKPCVHL